MRKRTTRRTIRIAAPLAALVLVGAACGDDDGSSDSSTTAAAGTTAAPATTGAATTAAPTTAASTTAAETTAAETTAAETTAAETTAGPTTTAATGTTAAVSDTVLKDAGCPDPLVIQTDWFPEADHGWTYELIGQNGTLDAEKGRYSGTVGGVTVEVRAGGPFLGPSSPTAQLYQDDSVLMAYVDTGGAIRNATTQPTVAIFAAFEKGPQIIMWDPEKYPDVNTIEDIGRVAGNGKVLYFEGGAYMDYLVGKGILKKEQTDASYDGSSSRFVSEGDLFQQGFATNEPYTYENLIDDWKKPVKFAFVHDAGFTIYQSAIAVRPEAITEHADCLKAAVPLFQQALVNYMKAPEATNHKLTEIVTEMNQFWQLSDDLNADAVQRMVDNQLVTDGDNGYIGDMDCTRVQALIDEFNPIAKSVGAEGVKDDLKCEEIVDNSFLDQSISLGS
jgi:hypothetical protein